MLPQSVAVLSRAEEAAVVIGVDADGAAAAAGVRIGDELLALDGRPIRDIIGYQVAADGAAPSLLIRRGGVDRTVVVRKREGEPLGLELNSAVFDGVRTCDNHCEFCFIHQLPPGMRPSLSIKDDDYRLSFLYGNFTTLTRFTEADLERVVTEGLSPLYVSLHATDPDVRSEMLRNRRGGPSLRWLRALLDHGVVVHGQIVVCPGLNDGAVLEDTLCGVLESYPELADVAVVPLGVSQFNREARMRPHSAAEVDAVIDTVETWQPIFLRTLGHRMVHAADEYYLLAGRNLPPAEAYGDFAMYEDGIGMVQSFRAEFECARVDRANASPRPSAGFFASVDGAPAMGYRSPRSADPHGPGTRVAAEDMPEHRRVTVLTGVYGAMVLRPLLDDAGFRDVAVVAVRNSFFGGNIAVAGLLCGVDVAAALEHLPARGRYLLPDVCLSNGRFLDGMTPADLPQAVEIIATDGASLRAALASTVRRSEGA